MIVTRAGLVPLGKIFLEDSNDPTLVDSRGSFPRHNRRLSDKLLLAFHQACDQQEDWVALQLLGILELIATRRPRQGDVNRRRSMETLVAAHERLWHIRHPVGFLQRELVDRPSAEREKVHSN